MSQISLKNINKIYPNGVQAVFDFNLEIEKGEFIVLVGPSGCGKSTTLRMIAGLEEISSGDFIIDNKKMNDMAPKDRDIAMVFQNYALYAHMSVYHNIAFSLVLRKEKSDEIHRRVMIAAEILGLQKYLNRKPKALSGGQRQRVAVGRAIVRDPKIFLFDEPLSNLDAKLRNSMRKELTELHNKLKTTMVYVTHDQIEALTLADRIVVMKDGYIQQIGTPAEIFAYPENIFVGGFIGTPPMNFFEGTISEDGYFVLAGTKLKVDEKKFEYFRNHDYVGEKVVLGARPEYVHATKISEPNAIELKVTLYELLGSHGLVYSEINGLRIISKVESNEVFAIGDTAYFHFDIDNMLFFDKKTEKRIAR